MLELQFGVALPSKVVTIMLVVSEALPKRCTCNMDVLGSSSDYFSENMGHFGHLHDIVESFS